MSNFIVWCSLFTKIRNRNHSFSSVQSTPLQLQWPVLRLCGSFVLRLVAPVWHLCRQGHWWGGSLSDECWMDSAAVIREFTPSCLLWSSPLVAVPMLELCYYEVLRLLGNSAYTEILFISLSLLKLSPSKYLLFIYHCSYPGFCLGSGLIIRAFLLGMVGQCHLTTCLPCLGLEDSLWDTNDLWPSLLPLVPPGMPAFIKPQILPLWGGFLLLSCLRSPLSLFSDQCVP